MSERGSPDVQPCAPEEDAPVLMVRDTQGRLLAIPANSPELIPPGAVLVNGQPAVPSSGTVVGGIAPAPGFAGGAGTHPPSPPPSRVAPAWASVPAAPQVELRSDELEEVVSFVPHWLVRWGTTAIFAVVATLLATSWFVRYPELVEGKATLTTPEPPVRVVAQTPGEIDTLFVGDGDQVDRGTVLAVLRNAADRAAVERVSAAIDAFDPSNAAAGATAFAPETTLGELQAPYTALVLALADLQALEATPYDRRRIDVLAEQMQSQGRVRSNLQAQLEMLGSQLRMAERERDRARELAARQLISPQELDEKEAAYLQTRLQMENAQNSLTGNDIQMAVQAGALLELQQRSHDLHRQHLLAVRTAVDALRGARDRWRQAYLLVAPTRGRVAFFRTLTAGQYLGTAEPVLAVVPGGEPAVAQVRVPQAAGGKVREGQRVLIRLDGFRASEVGTIRGEIEKVSLVPDGDAEEPMYLLRVRLPDGLVTSTGTVLPFRQEMRGAAEVITDDVRLFERLFQQLASLARAARGA